MAVTDTLVHDDVPLFVARPDGSPRGGLVLLQEAFGVNDHILSVAVRLAAEGYTVAAPALFHRFETQLFSYDAIPAAKEQLGRLTNDDVVADVSAAADWLAHRHPDTPTGVIGFCFGGRASFVAAAALPSLQACVAFYGAGIAPDVPTAPVGRVDEILCPVLAVYGDSDPLIPAAEIERLRSALTEFAVPNVVRVFPGGDHGFFCDARPANYNPALAELAWELTLRFLRRTLR